jgi:hypothetical protein
MPRTITIESYAEFSARHGGNPVPNRNVFLFPDGAKCSAENRDMREEPPTDPQQLLRFRRLYVATRLEQEVKAFNTFKYDCHERAQAAARCSAAVGPPLDAPAQLRAGKARIDALRAELADLDTRIEPTASQLREQSREEATRERQSALQSLLSDIDAVHI